MQKLWAKTALTKDGWQNDVLISLDASGMIANVAPNSPADGAERYGAMLPAPTNLHSHAFQRAMAGLTEAKGPDPRDSFWTWRRLMYQFLDHLNPDDIQSITAFVQMEMLQAGYAAICEFHYLHHQPGGMPYDSLSEMSERVIAATQISGIGLTLLPVMYQFGGCDERNLTAGQIRFGNTPDQFTNLLTQAGNALKSLPSDTRLGVAPHSLRAVNRTGLADVSQLLPDAPLHLHLAEQVAEVDEIKAAYGARPVEWLLDNHDVNARWCLIHATQMTPVETTRLAKTGAIAGLCPLTESSLGDGIFDGLRFTEAGGRFGIGSDSNIRITLAEELRTLEYSQRLRDKGRAMFATSEKSTGRALYDQVTAAGATAANRNAGSIAIGKQADLLALDLNATDLIGKSGDMLLDSYIFAGSDALISDVWSAGRHLVKQGAHIRRDRITAQYQNTLKSLMERI